MKRLIPTFIILLSLCCCTGQGDNNSHHEPVPETDSFFAKGADLGWITEMESNGYKFYNAAGKEMECTALFKELGFNSIRCRVWVNPQDGWCNASDVLVKALRAQKLGMKVMIDFHYSDWWADPGKQNIPAAWKNNNLEQMATAVSGHTSEVLGLLKENRVDVEWVQIGNETRTGMLWPVGELTNEDPYSFCKLANAGYDAVKSVYPDATVLLHCDNAWDGSLQTWFWTLVGKGGAKYDMIGLSLYPSYWDDTLKAYPDWRTKCSSTILNIKQMHQTFNKPVMLVEFGMPESEPEKARDALQYLLDNVSGLDWFKGIFLWEPESEPSRNHYDYGAFSEGKPTIALEPFNE